MLCLSEIVCWFDTGAYSFWQQFILREESRLMKIWIIVAILLEKEKENG